MRKLILAAVVICVLYYAFDHEDVPPATTTSTSATSLSSTSEAASPAPQPLQQKHWGSGHQAGYDWAEENSIDDEDACEEAGDNSNSPSFAEGCKAFVNGESDD
jgi:hypothetical protein